MKNKVNKFLLVLLILAAIFIIAPSVSAHPGNTDSSGCHTCRTNCASWGLSYGEYHCHNAKGLTQPLDPIRSHYGEGGTGYTEPWPDYSSPSIISQPTCPLFSMYDSISKSCKCNYGYVVDNGSCVSGNTVCYRKHGYGSEYDSISSKCKCSYGYMFDSSSQCVSRDTFCQNLLGFNAEYRILGDTCGCRSGYVLNSSQTSCISGSTVCSSTYGIHSTYNSFSKKCECDIGYEFNSTGTECIKKIYCPFFSSKVGDSCICDNGYEMDTAKNLCIKKINCQLNSTKINNQCYCNDGYVAIGSSCITYNQSCQNQYGINSYGDKSNCYCNTGYKWNSSKTFCIKIEVAPVVKIEEEPKQLEQKKDNTEIKTIKQEEIKLNTKSVIIPQEGGLVENKKDIQPTGFWQKAFSPIRNFWKSIFK